MLYYRHLKARLDAIFAHAFSTKIQNIAPLERSGSQRRYYRVYGADKRSYIVTYNANTEENETFFRITELFEKTEIPCPHILYIDRARDLYIQSDEGEHTLLDVLRERGLMPSTKNLYKQAIDRLAYLHTQVHGQVNYAKYLHARQLDIAWIWNDLFSFKCYFLDRTRVAYNTSDLVYDFEQVLHFFVREDITQHYTTFQYRDFQARNILVKKEDEKEKEQITFIDYQGAMIGFLGYDVVSLLYQARAQLSDKWRAELTDYYISRVEHYRGNKLAPKIFAQLMDYHLLLRHLQVLGAYGNRGFIGQRVHFLQSVVPALESLRKIRPRLEDILKRTPMLKNVIDTLTSVKFLRDYKTQTDYELVEQAQRGRKTKLRVYVQSFAYSKGIPKDYSGNGGGFVWDCRVVDNPGRNAQHKMATGKDKDVRDFLMRKTKMPQLLRHAEQVTKLAVDNYLARDFTSLFICFGCTGGQHRSVYASESLAKFLRAQYGRKIEVVLVHRELEENSHGIFTF